MERVNVICLKYGTRYPAHYVNRLYRGVSTNLKQSHNFYCCTDDPKGLDEGIITIPFPNDPGLNSGWPHVLVKLLIFQKDFGGISGPTLLLDVDLVITGSIDCFFNYKPDSFCMIHNWCNWRKRILGLRPKVGNSSVVRFNSGDASHKIFKVFLNEMSDAEDRSRFNTEQAFMTYAAKKVEWWPSSWVQSFKWNLRPTFPLNHIITPKLPKSCKILVFHGKPDPDEAVAGFKGVKLHHTTKKAAWIAESWKI